MHGLNVYIRSGFICSGEWVGGGGGGGGGNALAMLNLGHYNRINL